MLALTQCNIRANWIYSLERTGHKSLGLMGLVLVFGILGVGIDTVELSVTVLSITFKKGFGLKGWYLSTRPRTAAEMNNPSTVFALLSTVMKHYS